MPILCWAITGDSITGPTICWPWQYLDVASLGDAGSPLSEAPYSYLSTVAASWPILMQNFAVTGTRLAGANGVTSLCPTYVDPIPANKIVAGSKTGPDIAPQRYYVFSCSIGSNDGAKDSYATPALYAAAVAAQCQLRKTAGFDRAIMSTLLPRGDGNMPEPDRLAYNATITAPTWQVANGIDGIFDFASDPIMGNPANLTNLTYYQADEVHPTQYGQSLLVPYVTSTMNTLIAGL